MKTGDTIPTLLGVNAQGQEVKSTDFAGKPLIIYFYPKDNTPGCTAEACSLRDGYDSLRNLGYEVIGFVGKPCKVCRKIFTPLYPHQRPVDRAEPGIRSVAEKENGRTRIHGYRAHDIHHRCRPPRDPYNQQSRHQKRRRADNEAARRKPTVINP